jgi:tetratricopeptide (TPR) repeat protein
MNGDLPRDSATLLEEIVGRDPATALYLPLAERLREEGRVEEALRLCEERGDRPGAGVGDRVVLGRCYLAAGRLGDARAAFERALSLDRENVSALKALAGILAHMGEHRRAADLYQAVCRVDPGDLESQTALHQITSGEYPEARSPEILVEQGDVSWEPIRPPREEEHLPELSLGLRTLAGFEEALLPPLPLETVPADSPEAILAAGAATLAPDAAVAAAPREGGESASGEQRPPRPRELAARLRAEVARAQKAPVEKSVDQNRSAFQDWLHRVLQGNDR